MTFSRRINVDVKMGKMWKIRINVDVEMDKVRKIRINIDIEMGNGPSVPSGPIIYAFVTIHTFYAFVTIHIF